MKMKCLTVFMGLAVTTLPAFAEAPDVSSYPQIRPQAETAIVDPARPALRPEVAAEATAEATPEPEAAGDPATAVDVAMSAAPPLAIVALRTSPLPQPRPRVVVRAAPPVQAEVVATAGVVAPPQVRPDPAKPGLLAALFRAPDKPVRYPAKGSVCGDPAIRGQVLSPISARVSGCGQANPVRITAIDGVALSMPATVDCGTAVALRRWVSGAVKPTIGRTGGGLAGLQVAGSYVCRTQNHQAGARISEHGRAKAIDISALMLKDGTHITVQQGWRNPSQGPILHQIHAKACGTFGTVLGPGSDSFHQDHFHLDTAQHGYGPYCR